MVARQGRDALLGSGFAEQHGPKASPNPNHHQQYKACCGCGSSTAIECAHVRDGTDGGMGIKPSDRWTVSLCRDCHSRQHQIGEASFEKERGINLKVLAEAFYKASPHKGKLEV